MKTLRKYLGMRTIKTVAAVALCFVIYELRGRQGIPIYSALSAIWCIRPNINNSKSMALNRMLGTMVGAIYGLAVVLVGINVFPDLDEVVGYLLASVVLMPVIVTTVILEKKDVTYFSCAVFLSITIGHMNDANPYLFVWNRVLDTMVGILVAIPVNMARIPYYRNQDVLYVSGLDEVLLTNHDKVPDFSKRELNRMLDGGMNFAIASMRTPASLITPLSDLHIKLPVIAMDGAVLFSMKDNSFLKTAPIPYPVVRQLTAYLDEAGVHYFINSILEDTLFIYYGEMKNDAERKMYHDLKSSPYRNYLRGYPREDEAVVYLSLLLETELAQDLTTQLEDRDFAGQIRMVSKHSVDYPGYSNLKIYSADSSRKQMADYLQQQVGAKSSLTFGSIPGRYDIYTGGFSADEVVRILRRHYEPFFWKRRTKGEREN